MPGTRLRGALVLSALSLTARVLGTEARPVELLLQSLDSGFSVTGTLSFAGSLLLPNAYQDFGGLLSAAAQIGSFDGAAPNHVVVFRFSDVAGWGQDAGIILRIDDLTISAIPEPSTAIIGAFAIACAFTRRSRLRIPGSLS